MLTTALRKAMAMAVMIVLTSCGVGEQRPPQGTGSDDPSAARFQDRLDALAIPLTLPPGRAILINIPSYELIAFDDGAPVFRSRVIVGKPETRTPRTDTVTTGVTFWPSWRPTPEMIASGEVADRVFPPGPNNPMGLLVVTLETELGIAMHDTNQRHLFAQQRRAFSHGCIRVERWEALAAWLLDRDEDWVKAMAVGPLTRRISTPRVPVLIRYYTLFPAEDGTAQRHPDVYGLEHRKAAVRAASKKSALAGVGTRKDGTCQIQG